MLLEANGERGIRNAVAWAGKQHIRLVVVGRREAWKVADMLAPPVPRAGLDSCMGILNA